MIPFVQQLEAHCAKVRSVDKLDALQAIIDERRSALRREEAEAASRQELLARSGAHVTQAESTKKFDSFREGDAEKTWWSSSTELKRAPSGICPEHPSLYKPQKDEATGGWVGGPKWMFSRAKKRAGTESWQKNRNEPLMEANMQVRVCRARASLQASPRLRACATRARARRGGHVDAPAR